ncbi:hypothetical protein [uncultured Clostridium sp.]|uniref:hypothetical protein n=1 Tax=uncultured Clostridium sp. TaxID=59620 RepID=UPI0028EFDF4E|nr:hypothetical protein [uncultured Clostridium sp.]
MELSEIPINVGDTIKTFSVNNSNDNLNNNYNKIISNSIDNKTKNNFYAPKGLTTPIDGELFNIKRSYQFRESTLRELNKLKAMDSDINIYLNQILDKAICFYYNHITKEGS